jgi:hypothetical protein
MNIGPSQEAMKQSGGVLVPDPWTTNLGPSLPELRAYTEFVGHYVQEHTNAAKKMTLGKTFRFLSFMLTHGLRFSTILKIARQLISERLGPSHWKRVAILDALQFDVFCHYYRKIQPEFATFFLNSTAHLQHMHWRNMDPSAFDLKPSDEEQKIYQDAVLFGYQNMDRLLSQFMRLKDASTTLVFTTALSQQACARYDGIGGKRFCRPHQFESVVKFAGVSGSFQCAPVMAEEFYVHFSSETEAQQAEQKLKRLSVGSHAAFMVVNKGSSLFLGCKIFEKVASDAKLELRDENGKTVRSEPFFDYFYQVEDKKSGMHHPEGMLWISRPGNPAPLAAPKSSVPLTSVAPLLLKLLGLSTTSPQSR